MLHEYLCFALALPLVGQAVDAMCRKVGMSRKALAYDLGVSESFLSRALSGEPGKHISLSAVLEKCQPVAGRALGESLIELAGGEPALTRTTLRAELDARMPGVLLGMLRSDLRARKDGVA